MNIVPLVQLYLYLYLVGGYDQITTGKVCKIICHDTDKGTNDVDVTSHSK